MKKWMVGILAGGLGLHAAWGALPAELDAEARAALATDYARMVEDGLLLEDAEPFEALIERCADIAERANRAAE